MSAITAAVLDLDMTFLGRRTHPPVMTSATTINPIPIALRRLILLLILTFSVFVLVGFHQHIVGYTGVTAVEEYQQKHAYTYS